MRIASSRVHFIGIGGAGMSGLAELIHNMGAKVTGSDLSENSQIDRLKEMGIQVFKGHSATNVGDTDVVVYSSAVPFTNPEIIEAKKRKIPIIPRIEVLVEVMRMKRGIAVGGTHGKTTTTSMCAAIFLNAKLDPTVVVGGRLDLIKSHSFLGKGEWLIAESDESDGSFLKLSPEIAIITNIDNDHLDYYGSYDTLKTAYYDFAKLVPFYGVTIACGDSRDVRDCLKNYNKPLIYYGFNLENDYVIKFENSKYALFHGDKKLGSIELSVPGRHNILNATAAFISGIQAGLTPAQCFEGLKKYNGVDRRFQFRGEKKNVRIYDDYGHHPTEIKATLQAFREKYPTQKLIVAFQPHRYSRTQICWQDFLESFSDATEVLVWDIYAASEAPITGITAERLVSEIKHTNVLYVGSGAHAVSLTLERINNALGNEEVVFLTLGAGDISKKGLEILTQL